MAAIAHESAATVPHFVQVTELAQARANEIKRMEGLLQAQANDSVDPRAVDGTLPNHLRRRTRSHRPRQTRRNFSKRAAATIDGTDDLPEAKRHRVDETCSRRRRRRPALLRAEREHSIRSGRTGKCKAAWLETHLWHAKRFEMIERWGYMVPERPCDKGIRATHR